MEDIMVLCKKCGNKSPASSMKLDLDERKVICPECVKNKKIHKEIQHEVFHKSEVKKQDDVKKPKAFSPDVKEGNKEDKESKEEKPCKISHKCASCGYKFMIEPETRSPKSCPYCNARVLSF